MEQNIFSVETLRSVNRETFAGAELKEAWKPKIEMPDVAAQNNKDMEQLGEVRMRLAEIVAAPQQETSVEQQPKTVAKRMSEKPWEENKAEIDDRLQNEPWKTRFSEKFMRKADAIDDKMEHLFDLMLVKLGIMTEEDMEKNDEEREQASQAMMLSRDMLRSKKNPQ